MRVRLTRASLVKDIHEKGGVGILATNFTPIRSAQCYISDKKDWHFPRAVQAVGAVDCQRKSTRR